MNQESPITYQYDGASRLASVRQGAEEFTFNYDVLGQLTRLTQPNGISTEYAYDAVSRLTQLESSRDGQSLIDFRFEYDPLDRIASIRSQEIAPLLPEAATVELADSANRYAIFNGDRLEWDAHGNLTRLTDQSGHSTLYTWDARNRLTNISGPGIEARFLYNVFDQRIRQEVNGVEREYLYDFHDIVQETGSQGVASYLRTLGVDEPLRRQNEDGMASYYLTDHLGSTVALADSAGMITTRYLYEPFGHTMVVGAPTTNPFRFTGREDDGPTGLYYYRARYYSPKLQRFISEDPLDLFGGGLNFYTYAGNDPVNLTDPSGLVPVPVILCGVGGLIGFVTGGIGSAISQFISGGFSFDCFNARDALASAAGSAVAGCLSAIPFIGQLGGGFVGGALSNAIGGVVTRTLDSQEGNVLSVKDVFQDLTFGAAGNIAATRAQRALQGSSQFRNLGREVDRLGRLTRNGTVGRQARINAFNEAARRHRIILEKAVQVAGGRITNAGLPVLGTLVGEGATAAGQRLYGRGRP
jgi:RHS repeat-associated protein